MGHRFGTTSFAIGLAILLSGCETTGVSSLDLGSTSGKGTLVVGIVSGDDTKITLVVAPVSEDGTVNSRGGHSIQHSNGKEKSFYTLPLKPGTYVFRSVKWGNRLSDYVVCLNQETYAFVIEPGKSVYAGDIAFDRASYGYGAARFTGMSDRALVAQSLADGSAISDDLVDAQLRPATFPMGRQRLTGVELCGSGSF